MSTLSRSEVMRVIEETGKYSAVVVGVINNPADVDSAIRLIDSDIRSLEKELQVAKNAQRHVLEVKRGSRNGE